MSKSPVYMYILYIYLFIDVMHVVHMHYLKFKLMFFYTDTCEGMRREYMEMCIKLLYVWILLYLRKCYIPKRCRRTVQKITLLLTLLSKQKWMWGGRRDVNILLNWCMLRVEMMHAFQLYKFECWMFCLLCLSQVEIFPVFLFDIWYFNSKDLILSPGKALSRKFE